MAGHPNPHATLQFVSAHLDLPGRDKRRTALSNIRARDRHPAIKLPARALRILTHFPDSHYCPPAEPFFVSQESTASPRAIFDASAGAQLSVGKSATTWPCVPYQKCYSFIVPTNLFSLFTKTIVVYYFNLSAAGIVASGYAVSFVTD